MWRVTAATVALASLVRPVLTVPVGRPAQQGRRVRLARRVLTARFQGLKARLGAMELTATAAIKDHRVRRARMAVTARTGSTAKTPVQGSPGA